MKSRDHNLINLSIIYRKTTMWEDSYAISLGLTAAQIPVIATICKNNGILQNDLKQCLNMDKSTIAKTISKLESENFIERQEVPKDKRAYYIVPLEKALKSYPQIVQKGVDWFNILTEGMSDEEIELFDKLLEKSARNAVLSN